MASNSALLVHVVLAFANYKLCADASACTDSCSARGEPLLPPSFLRPAVSEYQDVVNGTFAALHQTMYHLQHEVPRDVRHRQHVMHRLRAHLQPEVRCVENHLAALLLLLVDLFDERVAHMRVQASRATIRVWIHVGHKWHQESTGREDWAGPWDSRQQGQQNNDARLAAKGITPRRSSSYTAVRPASANTMQVCQTVVSD